MPLDAFGGEVHAAPATVNAPAAPPVNGQSPPGAVEAALANLEGLAALWPKEARRKAYGALVGGLLRAGLVAEDVRAVVLALVDLVGDVKEDRRLAWIARTARRLQRQEAVTGWPTLVKELGGGPAAETSVARFRAALGLIATVEGLAQAKHLPEAFLRSLGLHDLPEGGVGLPYKDVGGKVVEIKKRTKLTAKEGSLWPVGRPPLAYGQDRLGEAREAGLLVLVEGESDAW